MDNFASSGTDATGNAGSNAVAGNAAKNIIDRGASKDALNGGGGDDVAIGGLSRDELTGGLGADDFKFRSVPETGKDLDRDVIKDFHRGIDDIDLKSIDTKADSAGVGSRLSFWQGRCVHRHQGRELRWYQITQADFILQGRERQG